MQGAFGTEPEEKVDKDKSAQDLPNDHHAQEFEAVTGYPSPPQEDSTLEEDSTLVKEFKKQEEAYLELKDKNLKKIKKLLKKVLEQQKLDAMPTLEDVKEGRVRVSQETLMGIKAIEDELEKDLKKITITGDNPLLKLRPEIEIGGKKTRNYLNTNDPVTIQTTGSYLTNDLSVQFGNTEAPTDSSPEKKSTKGFTGKNKFNDKSYDFIYNHFKEGLVDGERE